LIPSLWCPNEELTEESALIILIVSDGVVEFMAYSNRIYSWQIGKSPPFPAWTWCGYRMVPVIKVPTDTARRGGSSSSLGTHGIQLLME
jgi:hypothetical protein